MRDLLLTLAVALVLGLVVFGAVAFTLGKASGLDPSAPDAAPHDLPQDGLVEAADLKAVRFDVVLRGYRMDQVDGVLDRVGYELEMRDEEIRALRAELGLRDEDDDEPTGAHAARSDPAEVGAFPLGAQVSPNHTSAGAADDDTAILGDPALIQEAAAVAALGDTAGGSTPGDGDAFDPDTVDEDAAGRGLPGGDAAGRGLPGGDAAGRGLPGGDAAGGGLPGGDTPDRGLPEVDAAARGLPDEDALDRHPPDDGPRDDGRAAGRPLASDDTAVLDDLLGNERHPR